MGKASQRKGRKGEKELAELLQAYGYDMRVGTALNFGTEADVSGLPGIHIEAKRTEKFRLSDAMTQAVSDSERFHDGIPAVFHRSNRRPWTVTLLLKDFMNIYEGWKENEEKDIG